MGSYYPIYVNIRDRRCLVVGGGSVAERKVHGLLDAGARVLVVAPELSAGLLKLAEDGAIEAIHAAYDPVHLSGAALVFAATDRREVNAAVSADSADRGIPVNVADAPDEGTFVVPSVVRRGNMCISISTGANNPMLSARIADELSGRYGPEYGDYVELLGRIREYIKVETAVPALRRAALAMLLEHEQEILDFLRAREYARAEELAVNVARLALDSC